MGGGTALDLTASVSGAPQAAWHASGTNLEAKVITMARQSYGHVGSAVRVLRLGGASHLHLLGQRKADRSPMSTAGGVSPAVPS
jgi:hypothetical protein